MDKELIMEIIMLWILSGALGVFLMLNVDEKKRSNEFWMKKKGAGFCLIAVFVGGFATLLFSTVALTELCE